MTRHMCSVRPDKYYNICWLVLQNKHISPTFTYPDWATDFGVAFLLEPACSSSNTLNKSSPKASAMTSNPTDTNPTHTSCRKWHAPRRTCEVSNENRQSNKMFLSKIITITNSRIHCNLIKEFAVIWVWYLITCILFLIDYSKCLCNFEHVNSTVHLN